jgi:hypothetical protein
MSETDLQVEVRGELMPQKIRIKLGHRVVTEFPLVLDRHGKSCPLMPIRNDEPKRVVSLIASATEIVCALGARDLLVGRSHECDFPEDVKLLPVLTSRSNSASDAKMPKTSLPAGVVVSIAAPCPLRTLRPTPRLVRSCTRFTRCRRLRPKRSGFHTTRVSPSRSAWRQASPRSVSVFPSSTFDSELATSARKACKAAQVELSSPPARCNSSRRAIACSGPLAWNNQRRQARAR